MPEYKVLILSAPSGHLTLARAVQSFLEDIPGVSIRTLDLVGDKPEWDLFRFMYRYSPFLMKVPFVLTSNLRILQVVKNTNVRRYKEKLVAILEAEDPDLVITTYHGYIPILDQVRGRFRFKYINPISDPVSLHPILFSHAADYNIGFDEACQDFGGRLMIPHERIMACGWFTSRRFFEEQPVARIRRELGLQEQLTLMVCAGSEGNNAVLSLLPVLLFAKHPRRFQIIFIIGHNPRLVNAIRGYTRMAAWLNPGLPGMALIGFTDRMNEYIAVSDVVIGKAGPNLIFESVARQKPFIAISHISGNESGNLGMIKDYNLGWVAENPFTAGKLIKEIIANPGMLQPKRDGLEKMSWKCYQGGMFLRERVLEWNRMSSLSGTAS
jgi:processive 1,2-diacylglycerol beta-glucosyltransferase